MNKTIYRILFFILLLSPFATIKAQEKAMLIEQIEGKTIIRESFDRKDKLTGKQIFTVGNIIQSDEALIIDIKTELFDEALNLEATYTTSYECRPEDADVLLSVFAINPKKRKRSEERRVGRERSKARWARDWSSDVCSSDLKDKLTEKQIFTVGNIIQSDEALIIDIKTELFDEALNLEATYTTSYECRPEDADVLLSVFAINPKKRKIKVSVNSGDFKKLYALTSDNMIHSMSLTMYVETGILNFLGSKNNVDVANRVLIDENDNLKITQNLSIKAYLMGIRIKTIKFDVTEYLTLSGLLQKQVFKEETGEYFTVSYK